MAGISSLLKAGIDAMPDKGTVKGEAVPNLLKKQGVKEEELEFSGVVDKVEPSKKYTKAELRELEMQRVDQFDTEDIASSDYEKYTPYHVGMGDTTYKETVYTFSDSSKNRYRSAHFPTTRNYLAHTRQYDDTLEGVPTRVMVEFQSDLHQSLRTEVNRRTSITELLDQHRRAIEFDQDEIAKEIEEELMFEVVGNVTERQILDGVDVIAIAERLAEAEVDIPRSPWEKTWLRKTMERSVQSALDDGISRVAIPISGNQTDALNRSAGVQKWYNTQVLSTAQKLAKSLGGTAKVNTGMVTDTAVTDFVRVGKSIHDADMQTLAKGFAGLNVDQAIAKVKSSNLEANSAAYMIGELEKFGKDATLVIDIPQGVKPNFTLYASPAASAIIGYQMFSEGFGEEEIAGMLREEGHSEADIDEIFTDINAVNSMVAEGYTLEEVGALLEEEEHDITESATKPLSEIPKVPVNPEFAENYNKVMGGEDMTVKELVASMKAIYPTSSSVTQNMTAFFGDQEAQRVVDLAVEAQRARIIQEAANRGLDLEFDANNGEWLANTETGQVVVTPEWYQEFWEGRGEMVLGFGAGMVGLKAGARVGSNVASKFPIPHPVAKAAAGAIAGGVTAIGITAFGAVSGTELDYMYNAMSLQQEFEAEAMARKAIDSAELSVYGDAIGAGVIKMSAGGWKAAKKTVDFVRNNSLDRAKVALKDTFFVTDEEAEELVKKLERVATVPAKSSVGKAITATALTKPGADALVSASIPLDPRASRAVVKSIDDRAKDLLLHTSNIEGEEVGRYLREDLEGYRSMVKDNFEAVKVKAAKRPSDFRFDFDKLMLGGLSDIGKKIENRDLAFKFSRQMARIKEMSSSRTLPDLLELRKLVNGFKSNSRIVRSADVKDVDGMLKAIDAEIRRGAERSMGKESTEWLADWAGANRQYSDMLRLEKNVLAKVLDRPGVTDKVIGMALTKYASALDSTFVDVLAKLPRKSRVRAEGAVLSTLTEKFTEGSGDALRATNFPLLANELRSVNFSSPEARQTKRAIEELAEVFRNDVPLSQHSGGVTVDRFQSFLTTDPVVRAKFAVASTLFNWVQGFAPTQKGRGIALIRKTAKVLENPVDSKSMAELIEMTKGDVDLSPQLTELAKAQAMQLANNTGMPRVKLYGTGKVLSTKGTGETTAIPMHRIASTEDLKEISEASGVNLADRKQMAIELKERGYMAFQLGSEKIRVLE